MTILADADGVRDVAVGELLDQPLRVPHYQRPYSWPPATALQLVDDIDDAWQGAERNDAPYVLGAIILHREPEQKTGGALLNVVDGQQRLLTLLMISQILAPETSSSDAGVKDAEPDTPLVLVRRALGRRLGRLSSPERASLREFVHDQVRVVRVVTDDIDEAFRIFDSQNYRGKPLAPHDLLKAHHLREMQDETPAMRAAVVQTWESVTDGALDRLFSTYLYRIARWSRRESAPRFTVHDIGMFKGISLKSDLSPNSRYHLAAQAAVPMLGAWSAESASAHDRQALRQETGRSRFQLDAPLPAGRQFFEMVTFMLGELQQLAHSAFDLETGGDKDNTRPKEFSFYELEETQPRDGSSDDADTGLKELPWRSRYRYVCELYLAALLYYTNKFGDEDIVQARQQLFSWAYALRADLLRVQFRSIDNHARGDTSTGSAFGLLRDATSSAVLHQLSRSERLSQTDRSNRVGHEADLLKVLKELDQA